MSIYHFEKIIACATRNSKSRMYTACNTQQPTGTGALKYKLFMCRRFWDLAVYRVRKCLELSHSMPDCIAVQAFRDACRKIHESTSLVTAAGQPLIITLSYVAVQDAVVKL
jgi:hypothetical protein